jgi:CheY-like chemotaxis protein
VAHRDLGRLAMKFADSRAGARAYVCAQADAVGFVARNVVDLILLDVDASLMAGFVLAAQIRAAARGRDARGSAAIVAATSSECKFQDCLVGGSAIDGALRMPCDFRLFTACVNRWCLAEAFRPLGRREQA